MRILLTGRNGQVGWELERALAPVGEVVPMDESQFNLLDEEEIRRVLRQVRPDVIVNAAAYTAVDRAEAMRDMALRANGTALGIIGEEAKRLGALLVHYSTDYVFDGTKGAPYLESDAPNPVNHYGRSKLEGERAIAASGARHLILRTSWVYGLRGRNFLLTILERARNGAPLRVVDDQRGTPNWCREIAAATAQIVAQRCDLEGIYHLSASGETTWYGFARALLQGAGIAAEVQPVTTAEFSAPVARPRYSVLDCAKLARDFGIALPDWRASLARCMAERA